MTVWVFPTSTARSTASAPVAPADRHLTRDDPGDAAIDRAQLERAVVVEAEHTARHLAPGTLHAHLRAGETGVRLPLRAHARESLGQVPTITRFQRGEQPGREARTVHRAPGQEEERGRLVAQLARKTPGVQIHADAGDHVVHAV